jgi:hypothetical protein
MLMLELPGTKTGSGENKSFEDQLRVVNCRIKSLTPKVIFKGDESMLGCLELSTEKRNSHFGRPPVPL